MFALRNRFKKSTSSQQSYNLHICAKKTYLNDYISPEFYNDLNYSSSQTGYQQSNHSDQQFEFNNNNAQTYINQSNNRFNDLLYYNPLLNYELERNANQDLNDLEGNTDQNFNDLR